MLTIYGHAKSRAVRVLWMAAELGLKYDHKDWLPRAPETKTPEFRALNANSRVPTIDDDGFVIWESLAIVQYLARKYAPGRLLGDSDEAFVSVESPVATPRDENVERLFAALDLVRREQNVRKRTADVDLEFEEAADDVDHEAWLRIRRERVLAAIAQLPPAQREAVELAFFAGLTHVEVSDRLGIPLGTAKTRIRTALLRLRDILGESLAEGEEPGMGASSARAARAGRCTCGRSARTRSCRCSRRSCSASATPAAARARRGRCRAP